MIVFRVYTGLSWAARVFRSTVLKYVRTRRMMKRE